MAYGHVPRPAGSSPTALKPRLYALPSKARTDDRAAVITIPFHLQGQDQRTYLSNNGQEGLRLPTSLVAYLASVFNAELEKGISYPQREQLDDEAFSSYFLSYDLIVAFFLSTAQLPLPANEIPIIGLEARLPSETTFSLDTIDPETTVAGYYYIKPNYPGRSSHNCNAGFVVPPQSRGTGIGGVLGQSYLFYGPKAGYRASVFNLVYANNQASLRIWDRLGFSRIGVVPEAGLLRRSEEEGGGEVYVDAYAVYKKFDPVE